MARPRNADAEATRARILTAATRLFSRRGATGVSTRDIARASDVSVATLHHYFGTKDSLYTVAVGALWEDLGSVTTAFEEAVAADDDLATLIDKCVRVAFQFARQRRDAVRLVMRQVVDHGALAGDPNNADADVLTPFIKVAGELVAAATGRPLRRVRLELANVIFLAIRYALADAEGLAALLDLDLPDGDDSGLIKALEEHLVDTALATLRVERADG